MPGPSALRFGLYYHIYNRGNNREYIFLEKDNYRYFLELYYRHVSSLVDTFAYALLGNHFHFLIRIKTEQEISAGMKGQKDFTGLPSRAFSNLLNAYAKAVNKRYNRTGHLFQKPFGRVCVQENRHLLRLVTYIHQNPQKHGFIADFREWPHSSYQSFLTDKPTRLGREEAICWFGGEKGFLEAHLEFLKREDLDSLVPED